MCLFIQNGEESGDRKEEGRNRLKEAAAEKSGAERRKSKITKPLFPMKNSFKTDGFVKGGLISILRAKQTKRDVDHGLQDDSLE